jgi:hypothetical protein
MSKHPPKDRRHHWRFKNGRAGETFQVNLNGIVDYTLVEWKAKWNGEREVVNMEKDVLELLLRRGKVIPTQVIEQPTAEPPRIAEFCLALLLSKAHGEAAIGDLSERFEEDCERFGVDRARRMYWGRALKSLLPLLRRAAVHAIKWVVTAEMVRQLFGGAR